MATTLGSSPSMSGHSITNVQAPAGSADVYVNNISTHTHTFNAAPAGSAASNVTITSGNICTHTTAAYGSHGNIKFSNDGNIYAHDGNDWVQIAGLEQTQQIDKIKRELCDNFPDAAFDLLMKGLI